MKLHPNPHHWSRAAREFTKLKAADARSAGAPVPGADPRIVTADELYTFAEMNGMSLLVTNERYCCPTEENFEKLAAAAFNNLQVLDLDDYEEEVWDCEKFAFMTRDIMWGFNKKTPEHPKGALAIGVYIYTAWQSLNLHAIVCGFMRGTNGLYVKHEEPQSGKIVKLWPEELESCMGVWI